METSHCIRKVLEQLWNEHRSQKRDAQQQERAAVNKVKVQQTKVSEPAKPITSDMLKNLQGKFGK